MVKPARTLVLSLLILLPILAICQQVEIKAGQKPLNEVLIGISTTYGVQLSFDDRSLSKYNVTMSGTFPTPEAALQKLLEGLPYEMSKSGDVFVIVQKKSPSRSKSFNISGQVLEKGTMEPLPYSTLTINGNALAADLTGSFSYISSDSIFQIKTSHLGYYILDTLVSASSNVHFILSPSVIGLSEVVIKNSIIERSTQAGHEAGMMKLNHQIANFLPGFGDNSVFNLLRLQPGILASGEETNELIIWGCYEGQSKVMFDGFTIYGLKNFNDNISSFNPLIAKDIEVYKGGYDTRFGERVGGIVNITGKNGNTENTSFSVNLNNMTLNGMVEIPVGKNGSLIFALRHTYYELYNPGDVNTILGNQTGRDSLNNVDVNIIPDYRFRDLNLKYSAKIHNQDLFYISLYGGNDRFSYAIDQPVNNLNITKNTEEKNVQTGGSVFYGKNWKNGYSTNFSFNFSALKSNFTDDLTVEKVQQQQVKQRNNLVAENIMRENTLQVDNRFPINESNILEGGLYIIANRVELQEDTFNIPQASFDDQARRITIYFQDNINFLKMIDVKAGFRLTQAINLSKLYFEPRLSASLKLGEMFRINAAWGIYNQFVTKSSIVDDLGNCRYIWTVCDNVEIPVLNAMHYVLGSSFNYSNWTINLEGYYRNVSGLTRYIRNTANNIEGIYQGQGRSYGLDVMVKKDYKWFSGWVSYSLGKTEELFEYFATGEYRRAPQDQRHEVKLAALFNLDPFFLSADYVFGSGFPATRQILDQNPDNLTYSRLDVAFIYKFLNRRLKGEVGLSVLNVLNTENIKYANFERISAKQTNTINIYSEAIPITPALYLKIAM